VLRDNGAKYLGEGIAKCVTLTSLNLDLRWTRIGENGNRILRELVIKAKRLM